MTRQRAAVKQGRTGSLIRQRLGYLFEREVRDPRLSFVSVTDVEVSPDVRYARVFVRVLGSAAEQEQALVALQHAAGFFRTKLAGQLQLRYMPEISFHLDQALEYGNRIDALLDEIHQTPPEPDDSPANE